MRRSGVAKDNEPRARWISLTVLQSVPRAYDDLRWLLDGALHHQDTLLVKRLRISLITALKGKTDEKKAYYSKLFRSFESIV